MSRTQLIFSLRTSLCKLFTTYTTPVKNTRSALKTICSRNTLKASKKIAKKTISNTVKYAIKTAKGEFISGGVSSVVSWGASWYAGRYYTWATGGNRYETA